MADLGEIGTLHKQPETSPGFEISGSVLNEAGILAERDVVILRRPPAIEVEKTLRSIGGTFYALLPDANPRTVIIYDEAGGDKNAIVFDRVIPY